MRYLMRLVHNVTGNTIGLGHNVTATQRAWSLMRLVHNGPGNTMGLLFNEPGTQWDWDIVRPVHPGTDAQWSWYTAGPVRSGTGTQRADLVDVVVVTVPSGKESRLNLAFWSFSSVCTLFFSKVFAVQSFACLRGNTRRAGKTVLKK